MAPGEDISGLEGEYRLAPGGRPKLIYFKQPAQREEGLASARPTLRVVASASDEASEVAAL